MYLRKTTTSPMRGTDILYGLYQNLPETHDTQQGIDILQVGAGVASKQFGHAANRSKFIRRVDSLVRSLPLPARYFASYEPMELYRIISRQGFATRIRVADINANVLTVVQQQRVNEQMEFELFDISDIPSAFLFEKFDVCVALNVLYHIPSAEKRARAVENLVSLTKTGGYIVGVAACDLNVLNNDASYRLDLIDDLLYRKHAA